MPGGAGDETDAIARFPGHPQTSAQVRFDSPPKKKAGGITPPAFQVREVDPA